MTNIDELSTLEFANQLTANIAKGKLTIYDEIEIGDPDFWIPSEELELLLENKLCGLQIGDLALRTRSKYIKELICEALGYVIPSSFQKTQPRFLGQNFDVYTQKSNNLQIWNEEISPSRRYVIIRLSESNEIIKVKVVSGEQIAILDKTGTLTKKYQARLTNIADESELISNSDTELIAPYTKIVDYFSPNISPTSYPVAYEILSIQEIYKRLKPLIGIKFTDSGADQERNRGASLHDLVCKALGYANFKDDGRFPDVKHQLLEVKLQTSPTIDLGLFLPSSEQFLEIPQIQNDSVRLCDVRYAIFFGYIENGEVTITNFYLTTGEDFFSRFVKFGGNEINGKLQIPLKDTFFY